PETNVTRKYKFDVSYKTIAPDGVTKQGLVVNGGFPGPTIEANWGDWIEVEVTNNLDGNLGNSEGTTIHWHGLLQKETPFMDGVPSVAQCPIIPGDSFTYLFRADQYGTSWWHSHYSAQYSGGVYGAIIIHGPNDTPQCSGYDEDIGPVMVGDWYHDPYYKLVADVMNSTTGLPDPSNNNLINGKANYPCANTTAPCTPNAGLAKFAFESGKKFRMRLINPSSDAFQKISIDGHKFTVIANDFVPIVPYETELITLGIGQRTDVIVEATGDSTGSYWFRSQLGVGQASCSLPDGIAPNATAVIYYEDADPDAVPTTETDITSDQIYTCSNDPLTQTVPQFEISSDPVGDLYTQVFNIDFTNNGTNYLWTVNNISARVDYDVSQLALAAQGQLNPKPEWNVYTLPNSGTVRFVMYNSFPFTAHPMHMHGHNFQVLAEGFGTWDGSITNPSNPQRRDVQFLQKAQADGTRSYTVIQIELDNPSINILHCHLAWHVSAGLYVALVERPDDIRNITIPSAVTDTCTKWAGYVADNVPDQIDSGV
ncbi:laccase I, partial [Microthyrium microscopicum]